MSNNNKSPLSGAHQQHHKNTIKNEIWKPIAGYPNYEVSNNGHIRNQQTGCPIEQRLSKRGYLRVDLYLNGKRRTLLVHRLVGLAFVPWYYEGAQINHKDRNKTNNHAENLEWCDGHKNRVHGRVQKISFDDAQQIYLQKKAGSSTKITASNYGISPDAVQGIVSGRCHKLVRFMHDPWFKIEWPEYNDKPML